MKDCLLTVQELALEARATGKDYNPHKAKALVFKDVNNGVVTPRPSQQKAVAGPPAIRRPPAEFQVTIIPIFWNQNPAQKKMVIAKCVAAQEVLKASDISSHVDEGSHFTPGQKMKFWCAPCSTFAPLTFNAHLVLACCNVSDKPVN